MCFYLVFTFVWYKASKSRNLSLARSRDFCVCFSSSKILQTKKKSLFCKSLKVFCFQFPFMFCTSIFTKFDSIWKIFSLESDYRPLISQVRRSGKIIIFFFPRRRQNSKNFFNLSFHASFMTSKTSNDDNLFSENCVKQRNKNPFYPVIRANEKWLKARDSSSWRYVSILKNISARAMFTIRTNSMSCWRENQSCT